MWLMAYYITFYMSCFFSGYLASPLTPLFFFHYSPCLIVPPVTPALLLDKQHLLNLSRWQVFKVHKRIIPQQPTVDIYLSDINTYFVIFSTDFETVLIHNILCSIILKKR